MATVAAYLSHLTRAGERWDQIAWAYYGDPALVNPIIMANPSVPIVAELDAGTIVLVPVLLLQSAPSAASDLPPWGTL